jgi:hypothetical protein
MIYIEENKNNNFLNENNFINQIKDFVSTLSQEEKEKLKEVLSEE